MREFLDWGWRAAVMFGIGIAYVSLVIYMTVEQQPVAAGMALCCGSLLLAILILAPIERMTKGLCLIGLATVSALMYSIMVGPMFALLKAENGQIVSSAGQAIADHEYFTSGGGKWLMHLWGRSQVDFFEQISKLIDSLTQFINIASAGAGGSIIAVEGDRTSKITSLGFWSGSGSQSRPPLVSAPAPTPSPDFAPLILSLEAKIDNQAKALADLDKKMFAVDLRISALSAQQGQHVKKIFSAAIIGAVLLGFAIGAAAFIGT